MPGLAQTKGGQRPKQAFQKGPQPIVWLRAADTAGSLSGVHHHVEWAMLVQA